MTELKSMANMISVKWNKNRCQDAVELPQGWVFFCFYQAGQALWCDYTSNLALRLKLLRQQSETNSVYAEISTSADTLQFESYAQGIDALIRFKVFVQTHHPIFQQAIHPGTEYVYLALDAYRYPFVSLQAHTNDSWTYIGPWRSRFFLTDVIDCVSRIIKIPFCETGAFPCEKYDSGICNGYCLALDETSEAEIEHDLDKLDALLKEAFLHPNNGLLEMLEQEKDKYFDDLEFEKADLFSDDIENLRKYRDWLNFLYISKTLTFETDEFTVEQGLLKSCKNEGREYHFPVHTTEYRDNEQLALNLHDLDEARLIYEYHVKHLKG